MTMAAGYPAGSAVGGVGKGTPVVLSRAAQRDWALWVDWCTATGRNPSHAEIADLAGFLLEVPATSGVADPRVRHIARTLGRPGHGLPRPTTTAPVRVGPEWASHPEALAALRGEWYPEGVAARRDALILVLSAAGFTRRRIATVRPTQISTPSHATPVGSTDGTVFAGMSVDGIDLARHGDPVLCPRCALVRWLQVLDAFADRSRLDVEDLLTRARDHPYPRHDCAGPLGGRWRRARWVIPAIDRHGAIEPTTPLTVRSITGVLAGRYHTTAVTAALAAGQPDRLASPPGAQTPTGHRPGRDEHEELTRLWEQAEEAADQLNARILRLLEGL